MHRQTTQANILIVDDEPNNLLALKEILADLGQNIILANSGEEALRCVLKHSFAVILLDIRMPGLDGFETAALVRKRKNSQQTPIIFLTGIYEDISSMARGYEVGAVDYILKPVVPQILKSKITVFVDLYNKTSELNLQKEILRFEAKASEERFYDLVQGLDAIVWEIDSDTNRFSFVSRGAETITGYPVEQWISEPNFHTYITHPEDKQKIQQCLEHIKKYHGETVIEYRANTMDQREIWLRNHIHAKQDHYGKIKLRGVIIDITQHKQNETRLGELVEARTLELSELSAHLETIREEEKSLLSRELHDELGSTLTAVTMYLSWIYKQLKTEEPLLLEKLETCIGLVDSAVRIKRRIIQSLRPTILDDLGIASAVRWYVNEFSTRTGVRCEAQIFSHELKLPEPISIALFRVLQESLTNVLRHSQASLVQIKLTDENYIISLEIMDNGIGISTENMKKTMSHGLRGMRERIRRLNGTFDIISQPKNGTVLKVSLRYSESEQLSEKEEEPLHIDQKLEAIKDHET